MREIKFRVWIKKINEFLNVSDDNYLLSLGGSLYLHDGNDLSFIVRNEYIVNQYTGLKDKNGKYIYEGDIIKSSRFNTPLFVKWDYDQWGLFWNICNELSIDPSYDEIIGNVYENPELLIPNYQG